MMNQAMSASQHKISVIKYNALRMGESKYRNALNKLSTCNEQMEL